MSEPKIPIWTVNIRGKIYWTTSEESCRSLIKVLGDCEYKQIEGGMWDELVKAASAVGTTIGIKSKVCGYDGSLCNLAQCNSIMDHSEYCHKRFQHCHTL